MSGAEWDGGRLDAAGYICSFHLLEAKTESFSKQFHFGGSSRVVWVRKAMVEGREIEKDGNSTPLKRERVESDEKFQKRREIIEGKFTLYAISS